MMIPRFAVRDKSDSTSFFETLLMKPLILSTLLSPQITLFPSRMSQYLPNEGKGYETT
jgi:hypothetical protein